VLARLPAAGVVRALRHDPQFSELFMSYLVERSIRMQEDLVRSTAQLDREAPGATAADLGGRRPEGRPDPTVPRISQEMLAEMIGTGRTHVNLFMNKFRQLGLIEYDGDPNGGIKLNRSLLNVLPARESRQIAVRD